MFFFLILISFFQGFVLGTVSGGYFDRQFDGCEQK